MNPIIEHIYISEASTKSIQTLDEVEAVAKRGLVGDRYMTNKGYYSGDPVWDSSITLMEIESFEAFEQQFGIPLDPSTMRRNFVTRGITLDDLVGKEFKIGDVHCYGIKPWPPCTFISGQITQEIKVSQYDFLKSFAHTAGLGAELLTSGTIHKGDVITIVE